MKIKYRNRIANYLKEINFKSKFDVIDVGAKGDISNLLKNIDSQYMNIIGFEPNKKEYEKLLKIDNKRIYFNIGLFNKKVNKTFFITRDPSASSFFKPSKKNYIYEKKNWDFRKIKKKIKINCQKLDHFVKKISNVDFLKIDTQGSEYEILQGSSKTLKKYSPIVLTETWSTEVYDKVKLFNEVISFMHNINYRVVDIDTAAASWRFETSLNFTEYDTPIKNGFEILFIKNNNELLEQKEDKILKTITLLDLFGYKSFAYYLLKSNKNISRESFAKVSKLITKLNFLDSVLNLFPINIFIKLLIRYKIMTPINPQLHY
jgi:hypothetical protein